MAKRKGQLPKKAQQVFAQARALEASGSAPRKHHLVPASYLERWAEGGQIRVTVVDEQRDYTQSPWKAARETDYYAMKSDDLDAAVVPPLAMEVLLGSLEGSAKTAIDLMLDDSCVQVEPELFVEFMWHVALQFTRGAAMRAEFAEVLNELYKLQYGDLSEDGVREELRRRGANPTDDLIAESLDFFEGLNDGRYFVRPQDAALVGKAGEAAASVVEYFLDRSMVVFETPPTLITCDEPVVLVGGPGHDRSSRAGVATAGAVVFPLDPRHLLVLFRHDLAVRHGGRPGQPGEIGRSELDRIETMQISREIAMNSHRWLFERPSTRVGPRLRLPARPPAFTNDLVDDADNDEGERRLLYRFSKETRWAKEPSTPWPVEKWWD